MQEPALPPVEKRRLTPAALLVTLVAGAVGSLAGVWIFGNGTYDITPFEVELRVRPAITGSTRLEVKPAGGLSAGGVSADTHTSPLEFGATITGVSRAGLTDLVTTSNLVRDPFTMATYLRDHDSAAVRSFAIKIGLVSLAGGFVGGAAASMGSWRRMVGGAIVGVVLVAVLGLIAQQTYDVGAFENARFNPAGAARAP